MLCNRSLPRLAEKIVFEDTIESTHAVLPVGLLSLFVSPTVIRDADFVDAAVTFCDLGCNLGLESEPVFLDDDVPDDRAAEHLVSRLHVGQIEIREHVRDE